MIHAIILAAGRSVRMGRQKLLLPFNGTPIVDCVIKTALACGFDGIFVVVSRETLSCLAPLDGARYIVNPDPDRGQDSSFHCALSVLPRNSSFAVFLGDKPTVTPAQVMKLKRRFELSLKSGKNALVPRKDDAPGHPAFYSHAWRDRFLDSAVSSKATLFQYASDVEWAEFFDGDGGGDLFFDVDTSEDYRRLTGLAES